jgi:hypothetical protein
VLDPDADWKSLELRLSRFVIISYPVPRVDSASPEIFIPSVEL